MELEKVETVYHFKMPQLEKLVLTGMLKRLLEEEKIEVKDEQTKEIIEKILNGLIT